MNRDERQLIGLEKVVKNNYNGILIYATGFGKSRTAMLCVGDYLKRNGKDSIVHIIVPSLKLKEQWIKDYTYSYRNIEVFVINTYVSKERTCDYLIVDECHKVSNENAETFSKIFENTSYKNCLCLSATLDSEKLNFLKSFKLTLVDYIPIEHCIKNNWLNDYVEYNIGVELSEENKIIYEGYNNIVKSYFVTFGHDFNILKGCSNKDYRRRYCEQNNLDDKEVAYKQFRLLQTIAERSRFIYNNVQKVDIANKLINTYYENNKIIVFGQSIEMNKLLEKNENHVVRYDSKLTKKIKDLNLKSFEEESVNCLVTAKSLDEGYDNQDVSIAIVLSGTSKNLQHVQRLGRLLRINPKKNCIMFNIYVKNTKDEDWLKLRQKSNKNTVWLNELELNLIK